MRKRLANFWENYKFRFVPWLVLNLKHKKITNPKIKDIEENLGRKNGHNREMKIDERKLNSSAGHNLKSLDNNLNLTKKALVNPVIVHHIEKGEDMLISDEVLLHALVKLFDELAQINKHASGKYDDKDIYMRTQDIMHKVLGYSIERRKSLVAEDAGTGVFLKSGSAKPGSLMALYPGAVYMPREPLFFPSIGNSYIFKCSDGVHIDGNDKYISKSIFKSCAARDKFRVDLPCCDESWLTSTPFNPLNIGQYVNNRSKSAANNVIYQESSLKIAMSLSSSKENELPVHLCKYLPNVWANPVNNQTPLRLVPLVSVKFIEEGDEILSSYFTVVHSKDTEQTSLVEK